MPDELKQLVPTLAGIAILAAGVCAVILVISFLTWFWEHPAVLAAVVAAFMCVGYWRARQARV